MNILIPYKWLLEYLDTKATPEQMAKYLSLCGPSVERIANIEKEPVFDIEITNNRVDSMSVLGIAREAAVILPQFGIPAVFKPYSKNVNVNVLKSVPLTIKNDPKLCKRVMAMVFEASMSVSNPLIQKRLKQLNIRPLNNIVDITNYVMSEIGHPTHVFDYDKIKSHKLIIRQSKKGETATSFDNKKYNLVGGDIVIDDGTGEIIDLPGIIGTKNSVVSPQTKRFIFFLETNNHKKIRQTSMTHGIRTVAATLNEKAVDPELAHIAFNRGVELFVKNLKAKPISKLIDIYPQKVKSKRVSVTHQFLKAKIGVDLKKEEVIRIFKSLGFKPNLKNDLYTVGVPNWRNNDISIKEDLVEEVARIYGYHNIPSVLPDIKHSINIFDKRFYWEQKLKQALKHSSFTEIYSYSLIAKDLVAKANLEKKDHLKLKNPLSEEWEYLRIFLLPSLLDAYTFNETKKNHLALFEMANVYLKQAKLPKEELRLALVTNHNLLNTKEQLKLIFKEIGQSLRFKQSTSHSQLSQGFFVLNNNKAVGFLGYPKASLVKNFCLKRKIAIAEIKIDNLIASAKLAHHYQAISKYNHIIEDLTFTVPENKSVNGLINIVKETSELIARVKFKDRYKDRITITIYYLNKNKQLSSQDIAPLRKNIVNKLANLNIKLVGTL